MSFPHQTMKASLLCVCLALAACAGDVEAMRMSNALCDQGKALLSAGRSKEALDVFASATTRDGDNARAWNGLGVTYDLLGRKAEAEQAYRKALDLDDEDLNAVNNLAHLHIAAGNEDEAISLLEPHIANKKVTSAMRINLAQAYVLAGREDEAEKLLQGGLPADQIAKRLADFRGQRAAKVADTDVYADLGSAPTDAMAQARAESYRRIAGSDGEEWTFTVLSDVKVAGGVPVFSIRVTGAEPRSICKIMSAQAVPCLPHGK